LYDKAVSYIQGISANKTPKVIVDQALIVPGNNLVNESQIHKNSIMIVLSKVLWSTKVKLIFLGYERHLPKARDAYVSYTRDITKISRMDLTEEEIWEEIRVVRLRYR
jgi:hypothetical protein